MVSGERDTRLNACVGRKQKVEPRVGNDEVGQEPAGNVVAGGGTRKWQENPAEIYCPGERVFAGIRVPNERRDHWRKRHPEVTLKAEALVLRKALESPAVAMVDPKDPSVERRYAKDDDGKWWRVTIKRPVEGIPFVLTFHRVQRPGR